MTIRFTLVYCKIFLSVLNTTLLDIILREKLLNMPENGYFSLLFSFLCSLSIIFLFHYF